MLGGGRGDEKLHGCQDGIHQKNEYVVSGIEMSKERDISPTDRLLLEQLPTTSSPLIPQSTQSHIMSGENYGNEGRRFGSGSLPGLFLFVMYVFVARTPLKHVYSMIIARVRFSNIRTHIICTRIICCIFYLIFLIAYHSYWSYSKDH